MRVIAECLFGCPVGKQQEVIAVMCNGRETAETMAARVDTLAAKRKLEFTAQESQTDGIGH